MNLHKINPFIDILTQHFLMLFSNAGSNSWKTLRTRRSYYLSPGSRGLLDEQCNGTIQCRAIFLWTLSSYCTRYTSCSVRLARIDCRFYKNFGGDMRTGDTDVIFIKLFVEMHTTSFKDNLDYMDDGRGCHCKFHRAAIYRRPTTWNELDMPCLCTCKCRRKCQETSSDSVCEIEVIPWI